MDWKKYISKTYDREYWFNKKTGKSVWKKPAEVEEIEQKMKIVDIEKAKQIEQKRRERIEMLWREHGPQFYKHTTDDTKKCEMQIQNANGMSWTIEGKEHWTTEDYREELRNINQSLRDF